MLEIMKDSRLANNGGIVLILYFILKILLIAGISDMSLGFIGNMMGVKSAAGAVILVSPVLARINPVLIAQYLLMQKFRKCQRFCR